MKTESSKNRSILRAWILRGLAASTLMLGLTGPVPGNVGGCGATSQVAEPRQYCVDRDFWLCRRDQFSGRITEAEATACFNAVEPGCAAVNVWPAGCAPSNTQTDACIRLLNRSDLVHLSNAELMAMFSDCTLCP